MWVGVWLPVWGFGVLDRLSNIRPLTGGGRAPVRAGRARNGPGWAAPQLAQYAW